MVLALLAVPVLDELASGVAPAGAPEIASDLAIAPGIAAGGIVTAFYGLALLEAPLLAYSERHTVRRVSVIALSAMSLAALGMAFAPSVWVLAASLAVYGPASGCACAVSEGTLVESGDASRERVMARVTLAAALGDLAVPALLALAAWMGTGWRSVAIAAAVVGVGIAVAHARAGALERSVVLEDDEADAQDASTASMRTAFRTAIGNRALLGWSLAGSLTSLLDEVLVAFAAIHLADASSFARQLALCALIVGGLVGLVVLERTADRIAPRSALVLASLVSGLSLLAIAAFDVRTDPVLVALAPMALLGASSAVLHPLARAQAYAALPGRPALVNAASSALLPLDALAPLVLGALALHASTGAALAALLVAPVGVAWAALRLGRA